MDLLNTIQNDVMKQKEEEAQNIFERVADVRGFISETRLEPDTSVTIKLCCISAERLNGGYLVLASPGSMQARKLCSHQHSTHLLTLRRCRRSPTSRNYGVGQQSDKGSFAKANVDFQPGAVYVFRKVDGCRLLRGHRERQCPVRGGGSGKVFELELPIKKQKVVETPKRSGKGKSPSALSCKRAVFPVASGDDISMAMG
ncbi:hypothetical protein GQ600_6204 [Phytophthora cactorum]|nr:hypothetical protein GQ600_6204 [Phytophthora cactorum]